MGWRTGAPANEDTTMKIEFSTRQFVRSHMREPRGRGSWAFDMGIGEIAFSPSMTYAEAKRWAKEELQRRLGERAAAIPVAIIEVLP